MREKPVLHLRLKGVMKGDIYYEVFVNNVFTNTYVAYKLSQDIVAILGIDTGKKEFVYDELTEDNRLREGLFGTTCKLFIQLNFTRLDELEIKEIGL